MNVSFQEKYSKNTQNHTSIRVLKNLDVSIVYKSSCSAEKVVTLTGRYNTT